MRGRAAGVLVGIVVAASSAQAGERGTPPRSAVEPWSAASAIAAPNPLLFPGRAPDAASTTARFSWDWVGRPARPTAPRAWQRQKSARVAMISSLLVPGLGQMYNEREFWAAVAAGFEYYFIGEWISEQRLTNRYRAIVNADPDDKEARVLFELHRDNRIQSQWMLGVTMLISGVQALVDAYLHDFDESPLPVRVGAGPSGGAAAALAIRF